MFVASMVTVPLALSSVVPVSKLVVSMVMLPVLVIVPPTSLELTVMLIVPALVTLIALPELESSDPLVSVSTASAYLTASGVA